MADEETPKKPRRAANGVGLLTVQGISCAVVILAVLVLRLVSGGVFQQLRTYFEEALRQNALTTAIHALWDDETIYPTTASEPTTTTTAPAAGGEAGAVSSDCVATTAFGGTVTVPPLTGAVVTSAFGWRDDPFGGEREFHRGLDLAAPLGTPVAALWTGEVTAVDTEGAGSLGRYLRLRRLDGAEVLYAHCDTVTVAVGDAVTAGETVATVGSTGRSTGSHLHVQVEREGLLYDPATLLPDATYV